MPRPLHAGWPSSCLAVCEYDVLQVEPLSRDSWHSVVKLLGGWVQLLYDRDFKLLGGTEQLLLSRSAVFASWQGHLLHSVVKLLGGRVQLWLDRVVKLLGGTEQLLSSCSAVIVWVLGHVLPGA